MVFHTLVEYRHCFDTVEELVINEPVREKTNNLGSRPGPTQTGLVLYSGSNMIKYGNSK